MSSINRNNSDGEFGEGMRECLEAKGLVGALAIPGSFIKLAKEATRIQPQEKVEIYTRAIAGEVVRALLYGAAAYSAIYSATH